MDEAQDAAFVHNEIAAELTGVVAVRVVEFAALKPAFDVKPHHARMIGTQARAFEWIGFTDASVTVEQNGERAADFVHPLLERGECSKGNDEDASVEFGKFILARAQLSGMFSAGYSAQVAQEDEQHMIATFAHFAESDLLAFNSLQAKVWCGRVSFNVTFVVTAQPFWVRGDTLTGTM
jgi:hypothetical protein